MHVQLADEAICIGKAASSESYLRIDRIISAAEITDVDAIHPGYGFLSRTPTLRTYARTATSGSSVQLARDECARGQGGEPGSGQEAGVLVAPGSDGVVETEQDAIETARRIGYPS